jgi:hypothetical protein
MFWGYFHDNMKGPDIFWEKDWGSINEHSYREKIIPLVDGWRRQNAVNQLLIFMQDAAPAHAAKGIIKDL